jgi:type IV secretion system protein TrbL
MGSLRRLLALGSAALVLALALAIGNPSPEAASANAPCDAASAPVGAVTGAVGIGNPVGDACNAVTDPALGLAGKALEPLKEAASSIGRGIFNQITEWVADGATWLVGQVVALTDVTTSPNLLSKGFVRSYRQMALIAAALGALMLLFAVIDSLGRGDSEGLVRVFLVSVPLAAIATSAAYVVVALLIATTDGFSHAIAVSTAQNTHDFFKGATQTLSEAGAGVGAAAGTAAGGPGVGTAAGAGGGAVAVPLFVGFIAAVIAAFAALAVWIELLMRDAAIYAVALFMPLALAASIWPRWASALRRTCELVIVIVFSKFVIVSIVALASGLLANTGGKVEHVLAAAALLLLACFAPFVLFRLVPFAEGAISSAYNRQSAAGAGVRSVEFASSVQMMRRAALANWATNSSGGGGGSGGDGGSAGGGGGSRGGKPGGSSGGGAAGAEAGEAAGAGAGAAGTVALPAAAALAAAKGSKVAAGRLSEAGTAQAAQQSGQAAGSAGRESAQGSAGASTDRQSAVPRPGSEEDAKPATAGAGEPAQAQGGTSAASQSKPPRPGGDVKTARGGEGAPASGGSGGAAGGGAA